MDRPGLEFRGLQNEVHIWTVDLDNLKLPCNETMQMLPEFERQKSERFRFETLRTHYIKGHYLLRTLLGKYLGVDFYDQEFHTNQYGKPSLKNVQNEDSLNFNMSNSKNTFICVFRQRGDIGVDIEKIHDLPDMDRIVERFFSPDENETFHSLPNRDKKPSFFKYWARKEALLKAMGVGLSFPLDQLNILSGKEGDEVSDVFIKTNETNTAREWTLHDISVFDGFASAIALDGHHTDCSARLRYFHLNE